MKNRFCLITFLCLSTLVSKAQDYPRSYFLPPLDTPLIVTGVFGEIRDDHFHSGLDLSTGEREGLPVMSAAEGYISRIKISADGYGKALYITHPNGFVTVYGHLQKFTAPVNEYVRKIQYERQTFEVDLNLKDKDFRVKAHEIIAYSGKTGGAKDPHLHFEIRDEKTEEPINPLLFGFKIKDTIPPQLQLIRIYPLRENGIVNKTDSAVTYEVQPTEGGNILNTLEFPLAYGNIAFGFSAVDHMNGSTADLGIYSAELFVDNNLVFTWGLNRFNFDQTRDVNAHIDYLKKTRDNVIMERCHRLPGDKLQIYGDTSQIGYFYFGDDLSHDIKIVIRDFNGNKAEIPFQVITYVSLSQNLYQPKAIDALLVGNEKGIAIHKSKLDVVIPEGAVYENFYYDDFSTKGSNYLSDVYRVGDPNEALNSAITVGIKPNDNIDDSLKPKTLVVRVNKDASMKSCGGEWNGKFVSGKSMMFGNFAVVLDTTPPTVEKEYVPADQNTMYGGVVRILVKDNLSGIKKWNGTIDGKWQLFEYDMKSDLLIADIAWMALNKYHDIELTVTDERGNKTFWKSTFYY